MVNCDKKDGGGLSGGVAFLIVNLVLSTDAIAAFLVYYFVFYQKKRQVGNYSHGSELDDNNETNDNNDENNETNENNTPPAKEPYCR